MQNNDSTSVPIIILAGGQSQRLRLDNKYKWQLPFFGDKSLLQYIIDKARKQSKQVLINAPFHGGDNAAHQAPHPLNDYALPLIYDVLPSFQGPLAGLLTSLHWAKQQHYPWVATIACDTPFFPDNLLKKLVDATQQTSPNTQPLAVTVSSGGRLHPIFGLWSTQLYDTLQEQITKPYTRSISRWAQEHAKIIEIGLSQHGEPIIEPFLNINTLADYHHALTVVNQLHLNKTI